MKATEASHCEPEPREPGPLDRPRSCSLLGPAHYSLFRIIPGAGGGWPLLPIQKVGTSCPQRSPSPMSLATDE